jgi:hypothetical protein
MLIPFLSLRWEMDTTSGSVRSIFTLEISLVKKKCKRLQFFFINIAFGNKLSLFLYFKKGVNLYKKFIICRELQSMIIAYYILHAENAVAKTD